MPPLIDDLWPPKPQAIMKTRAIVAREPAALSRADGDRLRQDAPRHRLELPLAQVRRRQARALSGRPGQPGETDAQGVPAVRLALQQLQIQRGVHRPAPDLQHARHHGAGLHQHDPASLFHAQGKRSRRRRRRRISRRSGEGLQRSGAHRVQPGHPHRDLRHHRHRRMPPLHLPSLAPGAGIFRRPSSSALPPRPTSRPSAFSIRTW